jgi:hypothetical protein
MGVTIPLLPIFYLRPDLGNRKTAKPPDEIVAKQLSIEPSCIIYDIWM